MFAFKLQRFAYDTPRMDLTTSFFFLPSLTSAGRIRFDFDTKLRYEIFQDFFWSIGFWDNFDSDPPVDGVPKNDYGFSSGSGWSF